MGSADPSVEQLVGDLTSGPGSPQYSVALASLASLGGDARSRAAQAIERAHATYLDAATPGVAELHRLSALVTAVTPADPERRRWWRRPVQPADAFGKVAATRPQLEDSVFALRRSVDQLRRRRIGMLASADELDGACRELSEVQASLTRIMDRVRRQPDPRHPGLADEVAHTTNTAAQALNSDLATGVQGSLALRTLARTDTALITGIEEVLTRTTLALQTLNLDTGTVGASQLSAVRDAFGTLQARLRAVTVA